MAQETADQTVVERLRRWSRQACDERAFTFLGSDGRERATLTFGQLWERCLGLAAGLGATVEPGERALLVFDSPQDFIEAFLACQIAGVVAVPASLPGHRAGTPRLHAIAARSGARCVLTSPSARATLEGAFETSASSPVVMTLAAALPQAVASDAIRDPGDIAMIQYSSGSTGSPKGVVLTHAQLMAHQRLIERTLGHGPDTVFANVLPLFHDMGLIGCTLQPLYLGVHCVVIAPQDFVRRPQCWLQAISRYGVTTSGGPNFVYDLCIDRIAAEQLAGVDLSTWRVALNGAEPIRGASLERFARRFAPFGFARKAFFPCYGLAEATLLVSGGPLDEEPRMRNVDRDALARDRIQDALSAETGACLVSSGRPALEGSVRIVDPTTRRVLEPDAVGEIWVRGPSIAHGYWEDTAATAEAFAARLPADPERYLRTGDLGFLDADGALFVTGRRKDLVIVHGQNIYPQDLEDTVVASDTGLARAAAFQTSGESSGVVVLVEADRAAARRLAASEESQPLLRQLRKAIYQAHGIAVDAMAIVPSGAIPRTTSGKLRRSAAASAWQQGTLRIIAQAMPATELRVDDDNDDIARALAGALRIEPSELRAWLPLVTRGIDSLRAAELAEALHRSGIACPVPMLLLAESLEEIRQASAPAADGRIPAMEPAGAQPGWPLSEWQAPFWFLQSLRPDSAANNVRLALQVHGPFDPALWSRSVAAVSARHEALRITVDHGEGGEPTQRVAPAPLPTAVLDATGWGDIQLDHHLARCVNAPFDLARGPLLRSEVIRRDDSHLVVLVAHHVIVDLASLAKVFRDIVDDYTVRRDGCSVAIAAPVPLSEFLARHRARMEADREAGLRYWRTALAGEPEVLSFPLDHPPRRHASEAGARLTVALDADDLVALQALAARIRTTLQTALLSVYRILLYRYTAQPDVLIGVPLSCRSGSDREVVGCLVNPVAIRCLVDGAASFAQVAGAMQRAMSGAMQHGTLPLHEIAAAAGAARPAGHAPFQTLFAFQQVPGMPQAAALIAGVARPLELGGLDWRGHPLERIDVPFDIALMIAHGEDRSWACFDYRTAVLDDATVERFAAHFRNLLREVAKRPEAPVSQLAMLDDTDRAALSRLQGEHREAAASCVHWLFEDQAARTPDAIAVRWCGRSTTYRECLDQSGAIAAALADRKGVADARIGVAMLPSLDWVVAVLAVWRAGATLVPLDVATPPARLRDILRNAEVTAVICDDDAPAALLDVVGELQRTVSMLRAAEAPALSRRRDRSDLLRLAYIAFTSGSTGVPKGVMVTHQGAGNFAMAQAVRLERDALQRVLQITPAGFDAALSDLFMSLTTGGTLCIAPPAARLPGRELEQFLRAERITLVTATPSLLSGLSPEDYPDLVAVISMGEACTAASASRWMATCAFHNGYGPTETSIGATLARFKPGDPLRAGPLSIGEPFANYTLYLLDDHFRQVPVGVAGELFVGGAGVARGYLGHPDWTAERFVPDPFGRPGARLYRTGDRARWRRDGGLEFLGRMDRQIKLRGVRIEPAEIEAALRTDASIRDCHVDVAPGPDGTDRLVAYVVGPAEHETERLRSVLRSRFAESMVPSWIVCLDALPVTAHGKIDRKQLPRPELKAPAPAAMGALEARVRDAFSEVLAISDVNLDAGFFDLGGHSLLLPGLQLAVERHTGRRVALPELFRHPSVRALAVHLGGSPQREDREAEPHAAQATTGMHRPIAIVGMACRFPGAPDVDAYWRNIVDGKESITFFSDDELRRAGMPASDRRFVPARGVIDDIECFDAAFFGFSPREAQILDPQKRVLLELAQQALDDGGLAPGDEAMRNDVGVFLGTSRNSHFASHVAGHTEMLRALGPMKVGVASDPGFASTLVAYKLNLSGPCVNVDTACSTSLVAVHLACRSLLSGECRVAIAGGASIDVPVVGGHHFENGHIGSPDGHCRPFDAQAGGTVKGMGAGLVVLKPLDDALRDGDAVHAVILGSAINNDGAVKIGFTAPSAEGQARVIRRALETAGVPPGSIGYVEAHGTGTALGDPIEIEALNRALQGAPAGSIAVGSVKGNIGHLDAAAGIAGLIKAALVVSRGLLPPQVHLQQPNPAIDWAAGPLYVPNRAQPFGNATRRAGVSSFGIGGTNAHVVLEQPPARPAAPVASAGPRLVVVSAASSTSLRATARRLADALPGRSLASVARTLAMGRRTMGWRKCFVADSVEALSAQLVDPSWEPVRAGDPGLDAAVERAVDVVDLAPASALQTLGRLWETGVPIDLGSVVPPAPRCSLPGVVLDRTRVWLEPVARPAERVEAIDIAPVDTPARTLTAAANAESMVVAPASAPASQDDPAAVAAQVWIRLLGVGQVFPEDDFCALGGDSMLAIRFATDLGERLGIDVPPQLVLQRPTFAAVCDWLERAERPAALQTSLKPSTEQMPLSTQQRELWIAGRMEGSGAGLNLSVALRFDGPLDPQALQRALRALLARHTILLHAFELSGDVPVQRRAHDPSELALAVERRPAAEWDAVLQRQANAPFATDTDLLIRATLLIDGAQDPLCLVTVHHLVADGWSLLIMLRDLAALYADPWLPATAVPSYVDYARRQQQLAAQGTPAAGAHGKALPRVELPVDRATGQPGDDAAGTVCLTLDRALVDAIRSGVREQGQTLFAYLLAAFQVFVRRFVEDDDVVVASPMMLRAGTAEREMVGPFVSLAVFHDTIGLGQTFLGVAARVRHDVAAAVAASASGASSPSERGGIEQGDEAESPWRIAFALNHAAPASVSFGPRTTARPDMLARQRARHRVMLWIDELGADLRCTLEYRSAHYGESTARRFMQAFRRVLEAVSRAPSAAIGDFDLVGEDDRFAIAAWNRTAGDEPSWRVVPSAIAKVATSRPQAPALVAQGRVVDYATLHAEAQRLARVLRQRGLQPEEPVGVLLDRSAESVIAMLGVLYAGGCYVPLDPAFPPSRLARMIDHSAARFVITDAHGAATRWSAATIRFDEAPQPAADDEPIPVAVHPNQLAYILFTSGSTGVPKGVMVDHRALANRLHWMIERFGFDSGDRILHKTPSTFDVSVWELLAPLLVGARMVIVDAGGHRDPAYLRQLIDREQVTIVHFVPSLLQVFLDQPLVRPTALRLLVCSGEALQDAVYERACTWLGDRSKTVNLYGPTEAAIDVTAWVNETGRRGAPVTIGRPIRNIRIHILDDRFRSVPIGVTGELYIAGIGLARGYVGAPELTAERFLPDPFSDGGVLYRTGDRARWTADGQIEYRGRVDRQVKVRGMRVEPGDIEAALLESPSVESVAVTVQGLQGHEHLVAHVVPSAAVHGSLRDALLSGELRSDAEALALDAQALKRALTEQAASRLPRHMLPQRIVLVGRMPTTPSGKLNASALPADDPWQSTAPIPDAPGRPMERQLAAVWQATLGGPPPSREANFFDCGGDSLLAARLVVTIERTLGVQLSVGRLLARPRLADLAEELETAMPVGQRLLVEPDPVARFEPFPMTELQQAYAIGRLAAFELGNVSTQGYLEIEAHGIDPGRFADTWNELVRCHDMLRAVACDEGQLRVLEHVERYEPAFIDLRSLPSAEMELRLAEIRAAMSGAMFDIAQWPLFEVRLTRLDDTRHRIHVAVDALVVDGESAVLLERELNRIYPAGGAAPTAAAPALTYRDFAIARSTQRSTDDHKKARAYWASRLDGLPEAPRLPLRAAPGADRAPCFSRLHAVIDGAAWGALQAAARMRRLTPAAIVLTAYIEVLAKWSGERHFLVNLPISTRAMLDADLAGIVGNFTSTLLLEADLREAETDGFETSARRVHDRLWTDLAQSTFDGVALQRLRARRDRTFAAARTPIVFTGLLGLAPGVLAAAGDAAGPFDLDRDVAGVSRTSQVLLDCIAIERPQGLMLNWDHVAEAFPEGMVADMFGAFHARLRQLAADDAAWRTALRTAPPSWRPAGVAHATTGDEQKTLLHPVLAAADRFTHRVAVVCGDERLTYGELRARASGTAALLRHHGMRPGDLVAIAVNEGWEQVVAALAIFVACGAYVPVEAHLPPERQRRLLLEAGAKFVVTGQVAADAVRDASLVLVPVQRDALHDVALVDAVDPAPEVRPSDLAYVLFTSGSTGRPKGVAMAHGAVANTIADINRRFAVTADDAVLCVSGLGFDLSVYDMFGLLAAGGTLVYPPAQERFDADQWWRLLREHRVTLWNTTPLLAAHLLTRAEGAPCALRLFMLSGDWIPLELPGRLRAAVPASEVASLGGATEAAIWSICHPIGPIDPDWKSIPYGRPLDGQDVVVLDAQLEHCPAWVTGHIHIAGHGLACGYWNAPEITQRAFIDHPAWGVRLYRTGDLGHYRADGSIAILGRDDDQVKLNGVRLELGEVESAIALHPGVERSVVLADREGGRDVKRLVAYVALGANAVASGAACRMSADAQLANAAWDAAIAAPRIAFQESPAVDPVDIDAARFRLEQQYLGAILSLFAGIDRFTVPGRRVDLGELLYEENFAPRYRRWLTRAASQLTQRGWLRHVSGQTYEVVTSLAEVPRPAQDAPEMPLAAVLREETHSAQLYAQDGTTASYQAHYGACHRIAATAMKALAAEAGNSPLRVLEVGAGYGSITEHLLPLLRPHDRYVFTDISNFFLTRAKERFAAYPFVAYDHFDANVDPQLQGHPRHGYDVVVAASVLHNVHSIPDALASLRSALAPGGLLLMIEETSFFPFFDLGMGLQQGFDEFDDVLRSEHPLLSRDGWCSALAHAGFTRATVLNRPGTFEYAFGFDVVVAQAPLTVERLDAATLARHAEQVLPRAVVPSVWIQAEAFPRTASGKVDRRALQLPREAVALQPASRVAPRNDMESALAEVWRQALGLDDVGVMDDFFALGGDSLTASRVVVEIRNRLGLDLQLRALFEMPTIASLGALLDATAKPGHDTISETAMGEL